MLDVLKLQRHRNGAAPLTGPEFVRADSHPAGGDGALTASDLLLLQKAVTAAQAP